MARRFRRSRWVDGERRRSRQILAGLHVPLSNFGRAARQSTSVLICLGLALAGHPLNSLVRNREIGRERLFPRYQQKYQQNGRLPRISTCVFNATRKNRNRTSYVSYCYTDISDLVPLAGIEPALLAELDFESSASTSSATGAFGRGPEGPVRRSGRNIAGGLRGSTRADVIWRVSTRPQRRDRTLVPV